MSVDLFSAWQLRTPDYIYLIECEDNKKLSVKIHDVSQQVFKKNSLSHLPLIKNPQLISDLPDYILQKLIPPDYWIDFSNKKKQEKVSPQNRCLQAHFLLIQAQAAMKSHQNKEVENLCEQAETLYPESFLNLCVALEWFKQKKEMAKIEQKILTWLTTYEKTASVSSQMLAYKMLLNLKYSSSHFLKIVQLYHQESQAKADERYKSGMREKALKWLCLFIKQAKESLSVIGKIGEQPLYEILNQLDTKNNVKETWDCLVQIYLNNLDRASAIKACLLAFPKYRSYERACQLEELYFHENNTKESLFWWVYAKTLPNNDQEQKKATAHLMHQINFDYLLDNKEEELLPKPIIHTCDWLKSGLPHTYDRTQIIMSSLPCNIRDILKKPCPFKDTTIEESHHFVLVIPGWGLKLCQESGDKKIKVDKDIEDAPRQMGYWLLITKDLVASGIDLSRAQQCKILQEACKKTGLPYDLPNAAEAICYPFLKKEPPSLIRCKEVGPNGEPILAEVTRDGEINVRYGHPEEKPGIKAAVRLFPQGI